LSVEQPSSTTVLSEIGERLGVVPKVYRVMALDPAYLKITWNREKGLMYEGVIDTFTKRMIALTVLAKVMARELLSVRWSIAKRDGASLEQLFEALHVTYTFQKNSVHTSGMQLREPS